jgi:hypothetical protein
LGKRSWLNKVVYESRASIPLTNGKFEVEVGKNKKDWTGAEGNFVDIMEFLDKHKDPQFSKKITVIALNKATQAKTY